MAVYPEAIDSVYVRVPHAVRAGEGITVPIAVIGVSGRDMTGVHPLRVDIRDPDGERNAYSGYYAAEDGTYYLEFVPALNDSRGIWSIAVTELTSGRETRAEVKVE